MTKNHVMSEARDKLVSDLLAMILTDLPLDPTQEQLDEVGNDFRCIARKLRAYTEAVATELQQHGCTFGDYEHESPKACGEIVEDLFNELGRLAEVRADDLHHMEAAE